MSKVCIVGCGAVGEAIANEIVCSEICSTLVMYDVMKDRLRGLVTDYNHGQLFTRCRVVQAEELKDTAGTDVFILTAGARQNVGESRRALLGRNRAIMEAVVPDLVKYSPDCIICVVSNPADYMAMIVQDISKLPRGKVFGSGTFLDSSRFRSMLAQELDVMPKDIATYILGEHGDASVPCVEHATVAGVPLTHLVERETIARLHKETVQAAGNVIKLKGFTNTAIGMAAGQIVKNILTDSYALLPLSVPAKGFCGIEEDVFLSLPCVVNRSGIHQVWDVDLSEEEKLTLQKSAKEISEMEVFGAS